VCTAANAWFVIEEVEKLKCENPPKLIPKKYYFISTKVYEFDI